MLLVHSAPRLLIVAFAFALVAVAVAAPADKPVVKILRNDFNQEPEGSYRFGYENSDGSSLQQEGSLKEVKDADNKPQTVLVVRGSYQYNDENGKPIQITYEADEDGFRAFGDSIPKNPSRK